MEEKVKLERQALQYMARGEWEKAISLYEGLIKENDDPNIHNLLGDLYMRVGKPGDAHREYEIATKRFIEEFLFNSAIAVAHKVIRNWPNHVLPYIWIAEAYAHSGILLDCWEFLDRVFTFDLSESQKIAVISVLKLVLDRYGEDKKVLKRVGEYYQRLGYYSEELSKRLDIGKEEIGEVEEEISEFVTEESTEPLGFDLDFYYLLLDIQASLGDGKYGISPSLSMASALQELGLIKSAILEYQHFLAANPRNLDALIMLGKAFLQAREHDLALRVFTEGYNLSEGEKKLLFQYWKGRTLEEMSNPEDAMKVYREILFHDITFMDVKLRLDNLVNMVRKRSRPRGRRTYGISG